MAAPAQRARFTAWPIGLARFLPVPAQHLMSADQPAAFRHDLVLYGSLHRAVRGDINLVLFSEAEPSDHAQAVGFERENRLRVREEQNLLRAGFADPGKFLERFLLSSGQT